METPKYPDVYVQLSGEDGNTGAICGRVTSAMRRAGISTVEQNDFRCAVLDCGSYDEVLQLVMRTVETG